MKNRNVYIIAGPNGSGKTTFAVKFLPEYAMCPNFVNANLIAQGLSPFSPSTAAIKAGKLVLEQIHRFADSGVDFAFETTLSGKLYVNLFRSLKAKGYKIHLFFLWLPGRRPRRIPYKKQGRSGRPRCPCPGHTSPFQQVRF